VATDVGIAAAAEDEQLHSPRTRARAPRGCRGGGGVPAPGAQAWAWERFAEDPVAVRVARVGGALGVCLGAVVRTRRGDPGAGPGPSWLSAEHCDRGGQRDQTGDCGKQPGGHADKDGSAGGCSGTPRARVGCT